MRTSKGQRLGAFKVVCLQRSKELLQRCDWDGHRVRLAGIISIKSLPETIDTVQYGQRPRIFHTVVIHCAVQYDPYNTGYLGTQVPRYHLFSLLVHA